MTIDAYTKNSRHTAAHPTTAEFSVCTLIVMLTMLIISKEVLCLQMHVFIQS